MKIKPEANSDHMETGLPKGKFILHETLFDMATGIKNQVSSRYNDPYFDAIMNAISKRSVALPYLKPDNKSQTVHNNMIMI